MFLPVALIVAPLRSLSPSLTVFELSLLLGPESPPPLLLAPVPQEAVVVAAPIGRLGRRDVVPRSVVDLVVLGLELPQPLLDLEKQRQYFSRGISIRPSQKGTAAAAARRRRIFAIPLSVAGWGRAPTKIQHTIFCFFALLSPGRFGSNGTKLPHPLALPPHNELDLSKPLRRD